MFFQYDIYLILILMLFLLSYSKLKVSNIIKNLEHQNIITNNLIDTIDDGFYIWDSKKRTEKFSPNLLILFNTVFNSFNEFVNFFNQSEELIRNFTEAKKVSKFFTMDLKAKEGEIYCTCCGRSIVDNANNIIGVLLWIRNTSEYHSKVSELELENKKLMHEIENYKNIFNTLPYPILTYNTHKKIKFYNLFYSKYINNSQKLAITSSLRNNKHVMIYKNERKSFNFIRLPMHNSDEIVVYGQDISEIEKLHTALNNHLAIARNLLEELPVAIAIYHKNQKLRFYNNAFIRTFQLDPNFLASYPTYYEVMLYLFETKKLLSKEDFQAISQKTSTRFKELLVSCNDMLHLTNGKTIRVLIIPYASEGLLFSYEKCKNYNQER
jgi:PAS domain-containing protein